MVGSNSGFLRPSLHRLLESMSSYLGLAGENVWFRNGMNLPS